MNVKYARHWIYPITWHTELNPMQSLVDEFTSYALLNCLLTRMWPYIWQPLVLHSSSQDQSTCYVICSTDELKETANCTKDLCIHPILCLPALTLHTSCHHVQRWQPAPTTANYNTDQLIRTSVNCSVVCSMVSNTHTSNHTLHVHGPPYSVEWPGHHTSSDSHSRSNNEMYLVIHILF